MGFDTEQHTVSPRAATAGAGRGPDNWHRPAWWRGLGVVMLLTVAVLSLVPSPPEPPRLLQWDKAQHLLAYLVLAWWWVQCWPRRGLLVVAGLVVYGVALEALQALSPARLLEAGDMLANTLGALSGAPLTMTPLGRAIFRADRWLQRLWQR